ncbi:MAG: Methyltransferase type 11 [Chloroflexi bacterium]|nr:Methyltransferase type 11 [Chloroflexota bacterium]
MSMNFDRAAGYYDATRGYRPEIGSAIAKSLAQAVDASAATRFLEIGVGTGRIAIPLEQQGYAITGVDISLGMMARLADKVAELERAGRPVDVTLVEADMQVLPFDDGEYDAVIAAHVFHLVADPIRAALEALRVTAEGGSLLVCADMISGHEPMSVSEKWREIVRDTYGPIPSSAEAADDLLRELRIADPSLSITGLRPVNWHFTTTAANDLENIRQRLWSNTWSLPDDVFAACLQELTRWCLAVFGDRMTDPLPREGEFVIRRVRRDVQ